jgi:CDP-diacylglycerol--serine O-phosphatidyltransferase
MSHQPHGVNEQAAIGVLRRTSLADVLTLANGSCGMLVIATALGSLHGQFGHGRLLTCAALIVLGSIVDVADGAVARLRGGSGMGTALDTMSDTLTFGVAPATMLVAATPPSWHPLAVPAACLFVAASMLRLARFSSFPGPADGGFVGLAMPGAAGAVIALVLVHPVPAVLLLGVVVISALMVSEAHYPHPNRASAPALCAYWFTVAAALAGLLPVSPVALAWLVAVPTIPLVSGARSRRHTATLPPSVAVTST